jgi:hypothetical protein
MNGAAPRRRDPFEMRAATGRADHARMKDMRAAAAAFLDFKDALGQFRGKDGVGPGAL